MQCASCGKEVTPDTSTAMIVRNLTFARIRLCADCRARGQREGWVVVEESDASPLNEKDIPWTQ